MSISTLSNLVNPAVTAVTRGPGVSDLPGVDRRPGDVAGRDGFDAHYERELQGRDDRAADRDDRATVRDERPRAEVARREIGADRLHRTRPDRVAVDRSAPDDRRPAGEPSADASRGADGATPVERSSGADETRDPDDTSGPDDVAGATQAMVIPAQAAPQTAEATAADPVLAVIAATIAGSGAVPGATSAEATAGTAAAVDGSTAASTATEVVAGATAVSLSPVAAGVDQATDVGTSATDPAASGPDGAGVPPTNAADAAGVASSAPGEPGREAAAAAVGSDASVAPSASSGSASDTTSEPTSGIDAASGEAARTVEQLGLAARATNSRPSPAADGGSGASPTAPATAVATAAGMAAAENVASGSIDGERSDSGAAAPGATGATTVSVHGPATDADLGTVGATGTLGDAAGNDADVARPEPRPLRESDLLRGPGLDRMSIDLSDEGLGPLTLQAASGAGGLHLRLAAGDRAVGDALAAAADELRRDLEAGGTRLGSLDVGHRDARSGGGFPAPRHQPAAPAAGSVAVGAAGAVTTTVGRLPGTRSDASGLDLMI